ncbi:hypothetical protein [Sporisorium scitamineum]|uniref:Uncharacterized protein n=1 Tax=Sporisorium scitamineum TaxID=49012 RepID=A0A0F7S4S5_9BASI|nr:hypothetical protein [Sporisorium scitamineum]
MTDDEPRQLLPETESHQNLSNKLGVSRPLPPRSRSNKAAASLAKSPLIKSEAAELTGDAITDDNASEDLHDSHDSQATAKSQDGKRAQLEARGTASPERVAVQRTVSGSSVRSLRSNGMTFDIPKEEIEKALQGLDRDDLVVALGRAKVQMDEIEAQLDQQVLENETLHDSAASLAQELAHAQIQVHSLQSLVKQREERIDEIMADQERIEGEVYSTMQIIERLRKQLADTERSRNDAEKRYHDQTATMDKERQYYQDTEALLKSQKATQAMAYEKLLSGHNELLREHERITNRLASIKASGGNNDAESPLEPSRDLASDQALKSGDAPTQQGTNDDPQRSNVHDGAAPRRARTGAPKATTFAEERDMTALLDELSTLQKSHSSLSETMVTLQTELKDVRAENASLRDQNETFMDILQEKTFSGALLNESAMLRGIRPPPERVKSSRRKRAGSSAIIPATNLASELEGNASGPFLAASPNDKSSRETRATQRIGAVSDSFDELQQEVRELREANQALTLYITKIIDRIIAREGYENILAVETRGTVRGPRHKASRAKLGQSPNQKKPASSDNPAGSRNASNASNASIKSASSTGGGLFSFGATSGESRPTAPPKSKRTSSIDWRNLPFLGGGSSSSQASEAGSNLRPLTLQSDNLLIPSREGSARKVRTSEEIEDEHDVAERERIRQELLMRGIQPPKHQLVQSPTSPQKQRPQSVSAASGAGGFAAFFSRVVGGASSNAVLSPTRSDTQSQASTTPSRSSDTGFEKAITSTPAARVEERFRALQLSAGTGSSLTKLSGGQGIASRARQQRAERHQQTFDLASDSSSSYPFPSLQSSTSSSRATSGTSSLADSSVLENSIAGDESYSLPAPPAGHTHLDSPHNQTDSPLTGYGDALPPLPHETTGDEDPQAFRSPTLMQSQEPQSSQDQGWKRAFRRISLLSTTSAGLQPGSNGQDSNEQATASRDRSPLATPASLPSSTEERSAE